MDYTARKSNKWFIIGGVAIIAIIAVLGILYTQFWMPKGQTGNKTIVVEVVYEDQTSKEFEIKTDEEFLRKALESINLVSGEESEYGLFVQTVDNITVDAAKEQWWYITKSNVMVESSVDTTPIADKDHFEITFKTGFDQ